MYTVCIIIIQKIDIFARTYFMNLHDHVFFLKACNVNSHTAGYVAPPGGVVGCPRTGWLPIGAFCL